MLNAVLYYLPAFFLQRLVSFLENRPKGTDASLQWGYVYCVGLLVSAVIEAIVSGQLWFSASDFLTLVPSDRHTDGSSPASPMSSLIFPHIMTVSNSIISTRIRVQLNTLLFDKTLKRKDVSGVSQPTSASKAPSKSGSDDGEDDEDEDEGEKTGFKTKSSIVNLFSIDVDRLADMGVWAFSFYDAPVEILIGTIFLYSLIGYSSLIGLSVAILFAPLNNWTSKGFMKTQDKLMSARDRRVGMMNEVLSSIRMIKFYAFEKPFEKRVLKAREDELRELRRNFWLEVSFQGVRPPSPPFSPGLP
jgi:ABC-type multidrug transport system fused ATPase/permease subunit